jgi:hypothetical protein
LLTINATPDGIPKDIRTILVERGPWDPNLRLKNARMILILPQQPDFQEQKEWLQEVVMNAGFVIEVSLRVQFYRDVLGDSQGV